MTTTSPVASGSTNGTGPAGPDGLPASLTPTLVHRLTELVSSSGRAESVTTHAPFSGARIAELPQSDEEDVLAAAERARVAQAEWAATPISERAAVILRLHDLVLDARNDLMDLVQAENGKARRDAFLEVGDIANTSRYYARVAPKLLSPKRRRGLIPGLTVVRELLHPKGVVTVVSPWNYPLSLAVGDTIPALLAGNAVVQKPDNQTALTALFALDLARRAGLPEDIWQIVLGRGRDIGTPLLDIADFLMFTGSTASGRRLAAEAGSRLIDSSMELGGKNAMIVMEDAKLDRTVEGAVRACFSSSGQLCISIERMYVADGIWDEFVPRFVQAVKELRMGAGYDFTNQMGSLTSEEQLEVTGRHVRDAVDSGATVLAGGTARGDLGPFFFEPTVLTDVPEKAECHAEETFGPVVSLYRYNELDEAIEWANDTRYGLNASVWTADERSGFEVASRLRSGTVNVNEAYAAAWGSIDAPMGGMGESGMGRRHGSHGLDKYTEPQTIATQRLFNLAPLTEGLGDEGFAEMMVASLKMLKRIGWR